MFFPRVKFELFGVSVFPEPFVFYLATFVVAWLVHRSLLRATVTVTRRDFVALAAFSIGLMLVGTRLWYYAVFEPPRRLVGFVGGVVNPVGLASFGLYLGFFTGVLLWGHVWMRRRRADFRELSRTVLSHVSAYLPIGTLIGRVGCFLDGHKLGKPSDLPWALVRDETAAREVARHPLDLYQVLAALALFLVLRAIRRRQGSFENVEFWYVVLFASSHFVLDFFSREALHRPILELTVDQLACLAVLGLRLSLHFRSLRRAARDYRPATP